MGKILGNNLLKPNENHVSSTATIVNRIPVTMDNGLSMDVH